MARILQTPSIKRIIPPDPQYAFNIEFTYNDNQCVKNRALITEADTYTTVYDEIQIGMRLSHTIPVGTLKSGIRYLVQIQVFDEDGNNSLLSDQMSFYCYTTPSFTITNITNNSVIKNASLSPIVSYSQNEGETIANYQIVLYDQSKIQIASSPIYYSMDNNTYTFYSLENNISYYVRAIGETTHGIPIETDYIKVTMVYAIIPANAVFIAENIYNNGYITIQSNIVDVGYEEKNCTLEDGILTIENGYLDYNEGFEIDGDGYFRVGIHTLPLGTFYEAKDNSFSISLVKVCNFYYFWLKSGDYSLFKQAEQITEYGQYMKDGVSTTLFNVANDGYLLYMEIIKENNIYDMRLTYKEK